MLLKIRFVFIFLVLIVSTSHSQINEKGFPLITNYSDVVYNAFPQNWQAVQDNRGVMYFANQTSGILEYDGYSWRQIQVGDHEYMRSLAIDDEGIVYFGTTASFGYLTPDADGALTPVFLSDSIKETEDLRYDFWKIIAVNEHIYFFNINRLFRYDKTHQQMSSWCLSDYEVFQFFLACNNLYFSCFDNGLLVLKDEKITHLENGDFFFDIGVVSLVELNSHEMLAVTYDRGFYHINTQEEGVLFISSFSESLNQETQNTLFYSAEKINENEIALATIGKGLMIINMDGRLLNVIDESKGLISDNVSFIYIGRSGGYSSVLWVVTDKGLSKIEWFTPLRYYCALNGLRGAIIDAIRFNNILYLASTSGLFYYDIDEKTRNPVFIPIKGIDNEVWSFSIITSNGKEHLIACTAYNLFIVNGHTATRIESIYSTYSLHQLKKDPSTAYIALARGLAKLRIEDGSFIDEGMVKESRSGLLRAGKIVSEDAEGNLWFFSANDGVMHYNTNEDTVIKLFNHHMDSMLPYINTLFEVEGHLFLGTADGIYEYSEDLSDFFPTNRFHNEEVQKMELMHVYVDGYYVWAVIMEGQNRILGRINFKDGSFYRVVPFKRIVDPNIWGFYHDVKGLIIFSTDLIYIYDESYEKKYDAPFNALIRRVVVNNDSVIFSGSNYTYCERTGLKILTKGQHPEAVITLPFAYNNIYFEFAAPYFEMEEYIYFSFFLEGNDPGWSEWTRRTDREYTNLFEGHYTFHVKAKNIYGHESHIASYSFVVLPPWYRTIWAYISYFILFVLLIWGIVKLSIYRLQKINEAYGKYLPGSFLKLLDKRRVIDFRLGDMTEKEMTILFSDIRSYTNLSESMTPHDNFKFLVKYLKSIGEMLNKNKGFPVQYYGDGVMAMFHGKTDNAVRAAIDMHKRVEEYSVERKKKGRREITIGVGLHTGNVIMGIRGDVSRWEGGIVGDPVNIAARTEGLSKLFSAATVITEDVYNKLEKPEQFNFRYLGKVLVKGKEKPIKIYEVIDGNKKEIYDAKMEIMEDFNTAVKLFYEEKFEEALAIFKNIVAKNNDAASVFYVEMIEKILVNPAMFNGTLIIESK